MAEFFSNYGLFLLKTLTAVLAIIIVVFAITMLSMRSRKSQATGHIEIRKINEHVDSMKEALTFSSLDIGQHKEALKEKKAAEKLERKKNKAEAKKARKEKKEKENNSTEVSRDKRVFVMNFDGDIRASDVDKLREEVSAVLTTATETDEVVVKLESGGGMVTSYGLGASQLKRVVDKNIPLTVCVDKVAASGGYMMACVADKVLAAPFAMIGSIGVVAQIPNVHRLLKKHDVDFELITAGKYKRTLTVFGENTPEGREKFAEDMENIHELFKSHVSDHRNDLDIESVATGEVWFGQDALERKLIDGISTSDEYLMGLCDEHDVLEVKYKERKPLSERFSFGLQMAAEGAVSKLLNRLYNARYEIG
ncbi:MAG: protease SohB [Gammaproteobacteria bacterium]|nr:protease SohB [Gammaproteobacteria bacterium]